MRDMLRLIADDTWRGLEKYLREAVRKRAAIAYVGRAAIELLNLTAGDMIIIDASDAALRSGQVDPDVVAAWLKDKVEVRTLPGLHAKVVHLEGRRTRVVVGSANASAHSRDWLREAAVVADDEGLCAQVAEQLDVWQAESAEIEEAWLRHARKVYRPPAAPPPPAPRPQLGRLWIGKAVNEALPLSPAAAAAIERLEQRHGRGMVTSWQLNRGDEQVVRRGDEVVLVDVGPIRKEPQRNSRAWPPAVVTRVLVEERRKPFALLVWLQPPDEVEPRRYEHVDATVRMAGGEVDWDEPFPPESRPASAVRALWPTAPVSATPEQ